MVYMDKGDSANAKAMFQQYVSQAENGAKGFNGLALCDIAVSYTHLDVYKRQDLPYVCEICRIPPLENRNDESQ